MENIRNTVQENVPGKQVTLAHIIASPAKGLTKKIGLDLISGDAIGILTITPGEAAIIASDMAAKAAAVEIGFVDRFTGAVVIKGDVASVESALTEVISFFKNVLKFNVTGITRS